ncbi:10303_t:CDS:2, partial [Funneliformis geosporum]
TPQDAYHSMAGKTRILLKATFSILNVTGKKAFIEHWRNIEKSSSKVLNKWHIKHEMIQTTSISQLCIVWSIEAKVLKIAFSATIMERTYHELQESLMREYEMLILNFENLPNLHVNVYLPQHARNFRTLVNMAVSMKKMVHCTFKGMVSHTNHKVIKLDLTRRYNTIQALRHIIDGLTDSHFNTNTNTFNNLIMYLNLCPILSDWYVTENPHTFMSEQK